MSQIFAAEKIHEPQKGDPVLVGVVLLLTALGLVMLFSASWYRSDILFGDPFKMVLSQGTYAAVGLVLALVTSRLDPALIRRLVPLAVLGSLVLMVATFIPGLGASFLGGHRWILIGGQSFQPSELVKVVLVVYLASILSKHQEVLPLSERKLVPPLVMVFLFAGLIYLQNNFSTAVFVLAVAFSMLFVAGVRLRVFVALGALLVPVLFWALTARAHRVERLNVFLNPGWDPSGSGYQSAMSQLAVRAGELFGQGMGMGVRKLGRLPEAQSDFIFAVISEEMGFLGVFGILALFGVLAWRGMALATRSTDAFDKLLAFGTTMSILLQALINIAVTAGLVPPTGVPLPFFSSGGSSMLLTLAMTGLLFNVARRQGSLGGPA